MGRNFISELSISAHIESDYEDLYKTLLVNKIKWSTLYSTSTVVTASTRGMRTMLVYQKKKLKKSNRTYSLHASVLEKKIVLDSDKVSKAKI